MPKQRSRTWEKNAPPFFKDMPTHSPYRSVGDYGRLRYPMVIEQVLGKDTVLVRNPSLRGDAQGILD